MLAPHPCTQLQAVADHWAFELATILAVLANTILLAMPYFGMSASYQASLAAGSVALTFVFVAEATIKLLGWGRQYFTDPFNVFDFVVTAASLATVFLSGSGATGALRAVRLLRLLRLLTVLPALQRFLRVLVKVLSRTVAFFALLFILGEPSQPAPPCRCCASAALWRRRGTTRHSFMPQPLCTLLPSHPGTPSSPCPALAVFIFALLGMILFGGAWNPDTDTEAPRLNFNTIGAALATVYDCLTGVGPSALPHSRACADALQRWRAWAGCAEQSERQPRRMHPPPAGNPCAWHACARRHAGPHTVLRHERHQRRGCSVLHRSHRAWRLPGAKPAGGHSL